MERSKHDFLHWRIHLLCFSILLLAFLVNLLRGSKKNPSIVGM